jgi:hypothetical protein
MIVYNLHLVRITVFPFEAHSPSIIDADTVLTSAIAFQFFQSVGWRYSQVLQRYSPVEHPQLA